MLEERFLDYSLEYKFGAVKGARYTPKQQDNIRMFFQVDTDGLN